MLGTRGIWHKGWKAATEHASSTDTGGFDTEAWQLFHTDEDRSEASDVATKYLEKVKELQALWLTEAKRNSVLPLNDLGLVAFRELEYKVKPPATGRYVYYPGTTEVPEASAARTLGASFKILAEVDFTPTSQGVIFAQGSRFGGYTKDGKVAFVYNFLGIQHSGDPVSKEYAPGSSFVGGEVRKVIFDVADDVYEDVERKYAAALARD